MLRHPNMLAARTNEELIRDWVVLDAMCVAEGGVTVELAVVRGWLMDEIEKRWPEEFDNWIENSHINDNIEDYIKLA